jgi:hypothetical protein
MAACGRHSTYNLNAIEKRGRDYNQRKQIVGERRTVSSRSLEACAARACCAGYTRLDNLTSARERDLAALHGMGPEALTILKESLEPQGKALRA